MSIVYKKPSRQTQTGNFLLFWLELGLSWEVFIKIITEVDILPNTGDFAMHFRICSLILILKLGLVASFGGYSSYSMVWKAQWLTSCTF